MSISWTKTIILSIISCMVWMYVTATFYHEFTTFMINELFVSIKDIAGEHELSLFSSLTSMAIYSLIPMFAIVFANILHVAFKTSIFMIRCSYLLSDHIPARVDDWWYEMGKMNKESENIILEIINKYPKQYLLKNNERLDVGKTRFALAVVRFQENKCVVQDNTNPEIELKVHRGIFISSQQRGGVASIMPIYLEYVQNNETIFIEDNGTQFNLMRKNKGKWELFQGYSLLSDEYYDWAQFTHRCDHLDVINNLVSGLGSYGESHNKNRDDLLLEIEVQLQKQISVDYDFEKH